MLYKLARSLQRNYSVKTFKNPAYLTKIEHKLVFRIRIRKLPKLALQNYCSSSGNDVSFKTNYHESCETALNDQIIAEFNAGFVYLSMFAYFSRTEVCLPGCATFFYSMYLEELEHAKILMDYQNLRGGHVKLCPITITDCTQWDIKKALTAAMNLEKAVKNKLEEIYKLAEQHKDIGFSEVVLQKFIEEQDKSICEIGRLLARYQHMSCNCCGCTDFLFDRELFKSIVKKGHKNVYN